MQCQAFKGCKALLSGKWKVSKWQTACSLPLRSPDLGRSLLLGQDLDSEGKGEVRVVEGEI